MGEPNKDYNKDSIKKHNKNSIKQHYKEPIKKQNKEPNYPIPGKIKILNRNNNKKSLKKTSDELKFSQNFNEKLDEIETEKDKAVKRLNDEQKTKDEAYRLSI